MAAIGLLFMIGLGVGSVAHGAMLTNGSFEDPVMSVNSYNATPITGWTTVEGSGAVFLINGDAGWGGTLVPQQGSQWLYLQSGSGSTYVEQTVTGLTVGAAYSLDGFYGSPGRNGVTGSFKISLVVGGNILTETYVPPNVNWTAFNAPFTATSGSATIQIISMSGAGGMVGIDNLTLNGGPVPEPMTIGLMATGLLLLGGGRKRRLASTHS